MSPIVEPSGGGGGGGGGFTPVSCVVGLSAPIDIHAAGDYPISWDELVDNGFDFNPLAAIPAGLGLTFAFDGSSAFFDTTVAGLWSFFFECPFQNGPDATVRGSLTLLGWGVGQSFGPVGGSHATVAATGVYALPAGVHSTFAIIVDTNATANPFNVQPTMSIVRLA